MGKIQTRQQALLEIVGKEKVFSQEDLIQKLATRGIEATQATLSRDLKMLNIKKLPGQGYKLPHEHQPSAKGMGIGVMSLEINGNIAVLRTQLGFAPALALYLDRHPSAPIMGTIAGDDTVLLALRQGYSPEQLVDALSILLSDIRDRVIQNNE